MLFSESHRQLAGRQLPDGSFPAHPGAPPRTDTTAWAVLALRHQRAALPALGRARRWLAKRQLADGRVPVLASHPDAIWPTPLAVLAWWGAPEFRDASRRAVGFILAHTGTHPPRAPNSPGRHDTSLRGWPWNLETHSWVIPTSLCLFALRLTGHERAARFAEAVKMLRDRRVPDGGWNYGSTVVYGTELLPFPETTGMALDALRGRVSRQWAASSLAYLAGIVPRMRTPLSLGWGLLGLSAWQSRPPEAADWIRQTLARQQTLGAYPTPELALLLVAAQARRGLLSLFSEGGER